MTWSYELTEIDTRHLSLRLATVDHHFHRLAPKLLFIDNVLPFCFHRILSFHLSSRVRQIGGVSIAELVAARDTKVAGLQFEHAVGKNTQLEVTTIDTLYHDTPIFVSELHRVSS